MALQLVISRGAQAGSAVALALLLTYAAHALVWTSAAALLARGRSRSSSAQNSLWRLALLAPLVTAALAFAVPLRLEPAEQALPVAGLQLAWLAEASVPAYGVAATPSLWTTLGACAQIGALAGLLRWLVGALLFARKLRSRWPVHDARWLQRLERLRVRTRISHVTLTQSHHVSSPLVLGAAEICLPAHLSRLEDAELDSVLAHELAHIERRDGLWFPAVGLIQAVLWLQPLSSWSAARFRRTAEEACDDRAVDLTQDPRGLARVLVQLASAALPRAATPFAPTMAHAKSALLTRIQRLTQDTPSGRRRAPRYLSLLASLGLAALGFVTVSLSVRVATASPPAAATAAPDAAAVSAQLAQLARREQQLEITIGSAATTSGGERPAASAVQRLELQQELDHLRATQQWLEQRFLEQETAWQAQQHRPEP